MQACRNLTIDRDILDWARERDFAVVTLDADFHTLLAVSGAARPSVVRLRVQGANAEVVTRLLESVLERFSAELKWGSMITAKAKKMTCHRLPVGGGR
jgi:predicted nuclease of predicted toxin-antitoxin system